MISSRLAIALATTAVFLTASLRGETGDVFPENPTGWPVVSITNKPWTRWWWLGSAVDKRNLTRELEAFAQAGLGGVEICPIYGAVGAEKRFIDFLSPEWMEMLAHTTTEAKRLDLGVDMTTGTGWPFGGPMVTPDMASQGLQRIVSQARGGEKVSLKLPTGTLQCLRAFPQDGAPVDLMPHVNSGVLEWTPPAGDWTIAGLAANSEIQKVKRAAPGGQGHVLDPFSPVAMKRYLAGFDHAFAKFSAPKPRAHFHDSFEYYGADWTPRLLDAFQSTRGYDLRDQLPAFNGIGEPDVVTRVRADYRRTLGELHRDYLRAWHDWAKENGSITRNQAHGSPGNLLDHYAVSEIPETEIFRHVDEDQIPMLRFAASAAHANGNTLVSAEIFTWLGEHFQVTPDQLKEAADFVFLGGVNHIFFHGIPYSPDDVPWPGWLFYASTHMGPNGGLWRDLPAFTGYLQRCQSILQHGKPDSEVLLYFPFADLIHDDRANLPLFTIHNQNEWLHPTAFYQTSMELWNHGITFDYASDEMLSRATVRDGRIQLGGNTFKALVLPDVKHIDPATMEVLVRLAGQGGKIVIQNRFPKDVPGLANLERRRDALKRVEESHSSLFIFARGSVLPALSGLGVLREPMCEAGLRFVRRKHPGGHHYFIVNRSGESRQLPAKLAVPHQAVAVLDPWSPDRPGAILSHLPPMTLAPNQSIILRTFNDRKAEAASPPRDFQETATIPLDGPWKLEFVDGGPALPKPAELATLASWTTLSDPAASVFSGTARYTTHFDFRGEKSSNIRLDLGKVAGTARVLLNDRPVGVSWCSPHLLDVSGHVKPGDNRLAIEVTNLAANRIADLDRRKAPWKNFHEINFVNIDYQPFDASAWPALESGLLGPVRILVSTPTR